MTGERSSLAETAVDLARRLKAVTDRPVLTVAGLTVPAPGGARAVVDDVSFTIRAGEVLGIAGVEGNGQRTLVRALSDLVQVRSCRIRRRRRRSGFS